MTKPRVRALDSHMREILSKGSISIALKFIGTGLNFLFQVLLARLLGASGVGVYFIALALATSTALIARLGMDYNVLRVTAVNTENQRWGIVRTNFRRASGIGLVASLIGAFLLYVAAGWLSSSVFSKPELAMPLRIMAFAVVPLAMTILYARALQGQKRVFEATLVEMVITPLVACSLVYWFVTRLEIAGAAISFSIGSSIALVAAALSWHGRYRDRQLNGPESPDHAPIRFIWDSFPLLGTALLQQLSQVIPLFVLGAFGTGADAGIFYAAYRTSALVGLILIAANGIIAPKFAALFHSGQLATLNNVACNSALVLTLIAMPALLLFLFAPGIVMMIFGKEFVQGTELLRILAIGQLVNVMTGSLGFLLIMTDNTRSMFRTTAWMLVANVTLSVSLIPPYGAVGAALAIAGSLGVAGVLRTFFVWRELGLLALPIVRRNKALGDKIE